jgi:hypothetical protein
MSIQSIATELYNLKSKKNTTLSAAFSIMLREELAARLSIYNLVRTVTRSPLLATIAQYKFGKLTPLQKQEQEEESRTKRADLKFKQFTATSIANLNRKINTLSAITQKNTQLIQSLYDQIGSSRFERKTNVMRSAQAMRVPGRSKTVKAQIAQIQQDIAALSKQKVYTPKKRISPTKSTEQQKKDNSDALGGILGKLLPIIASNPRLLALIAGGTAGAISLGSFAMQAYSMAALPEVGGRFFGRLKGERGTYTDPITGETRKYTDSEEEMSRYMDMGIGVVGAYTAGRVLTSATSMAAKFFKSRAPKPIDPNELAIMKSAGLKGSATRYPSLASYQVPGAYSVFTKGGDIRFKDEKTGRFISDAEALKRRGIDPAEKIKTVSPGLVKFLKYAQPILKKLPAVSAAYGAYLLTQIGSKTVDYEEGKLSHAQFKEAVVPMYGDLIETMGVSAFTTILGALGGTLVGGPFGTIAGAATGFLGGAAFSIASMFLDDPSNGRWTDWGAEKIFDLIYHDKKTIDVSSPAAKAGQAAAPGTGPRSVRNNNPGNLRYSPNLVKPGYVLEKAVGADSGGFAIFATPQDGLEAMEKQVRLDTQTRGMTLSQFVNKYAPPNENDTNKYTKFVSDRTGLMANDRIPASKIPEVMNAMILMEGGRPASQYYASVGGSDRMLVASATPAPEPRRARGATVATAAPAPVVPEMQRQVQVVQTRTVEPQATQQPMIGDEFSSRIDDTQAMSVAALGASQVLAGTIQKMQSSIVDLATLAKMDKEIYVENFDSSLSNYRLS